MNRGQRLFCVQGELETKEAFVSIKEQQPSNHSDDE
jgi:hypothetical protein